MLVAPSPEDAGAALFGQAGQFLGDTCLADARLPGQHHQPAPA